MEILLALVSLVVGLGSLVCLIIVLTKLFPAEGVLVGIFGIFCGLYTFIWGWQNVDRHSLQPVMTIWTIFFVTSILVQVLSLSIGS